MKLRVILRKSINVYNSNKPYESIKGSVIFRNSVLSPICGSCVIPTVRSVPFSFYPARKDQMEF